MIYLCGQHDHLRESQGESEGERERETKSERESERARERERERERESEREREREREREGGPQLSVCRSPGSGQCSFSGETLLLLPPRPSQTYTRAREHEGPRGIGSGCEIHTRGDDTCEGGRHDTTVLY